MADDNSLGTWLLGGGGMLTLGGGITWLWGKITEHRQSREAKLSAREGEYVKNLEERLGKIEARMGAAERRASLAGQVCIMALDELERLNPSSVLIEQGRRMLRREFPELFEKPSITPELQAYLDKLK